MDKVLVTGSSGYLGSRFLQCYEKDFDLVPFDMAGGFDILRPEDLDQAMVGCSKVVHLAAIPKPVEGLSFQKYLDVNVQGTQNVLAAAKRAGVTRVVYASSTTIYGVEQGIPFHYPVSEDQAFVSQYLKVGDLSCRDVDLSYHMSKVMAEQVLAWYGLNGYLETVALRFGPIGKVFLGTSVSDNNACQGIALALTNTKLRGYEAFSIVDELDHISIAKARRMLGYEPEVFDYPTEKMRSRLEDRATLD